MLKINFTVAAMLVLVIGFAAPVWAGGGGGPSGDGIGVTRDIGALLTITDPTRGGNPANYTYTLFGASGDTLFIQDWNGNGTPSPGVARVVGGDLLWILDFAANGTLTYELFGSAGDIPVVGDFDTATAGVEIGVARPNSTNGTLEWILKDSAAGPGFTREFFGVDTDTPVVGNWNGDANDGDEKGLTRADGGALLWITEGSGGLEYALFGAATDTPINGDYDGDGTEDLAVRPSSGDGNVVIINLSPTEYFQLGLASDSALNTGSLGQP